MNMNLENNQQETSVEPSPSREAGSSPVLSQTANILLHVQIAKKEPIYIRPDQQIRCDLKLQIPKECVQFQFVRLADAHSTNEHYPQLRVKVFVMDGAAEKELIPNVCRHCNSRSRGQTVRLHGTSRSQNGDLVLSRSTSASPEYYSSTGEFAFSISCSSSHWGPQAINGYRLEFILYTSEGRLISSYNSDQRVTIVQKRKDRGAKDIIELDAKRRCQDSPTEVISRPYDNPVPIPQDNVQPLLTKIYPTESDIRGGERVTLKVNPSLDGSTSYFVHFGIQSVEAHRFEADILTCQVPPVQSAGLVPVFITSTVNELKAGDFVGAIMFRYTAQEASLIPESKKAGYVCNFQHDSTHQGHIAHTIMPRHPSLPVWTSQSESGSSPAASKSPASSLTWNSLQSLCVSLDRKRSHSSNSAHSSSRKSLSDLTSFGKAAFLKIPHLLLI